MIILIMYIIASYIFNTAVWVQERKSNDGIGPYEVIMCALSPLSVIWIAGTSYRRNNPYEA